MHDDEHRSEAPPAPPAEDQGPGAPTVGEQVMDILQDVERQFERLRNAQSARDRDVATIAERSSELDRRAQELDASRGELEQLRREMEDQRGALERREGQLERQARDLSRTESELTELRASLGHDRRELDG